MQLIYENFAKIFNEEKNKCTIGHAAKGQTVTTHEYWTFEVVWYRNDSATILMPFSAFWGGHTRPTWSAWQPSLIIVNGSRSQSYNDPIGSTWHPLIFIYIAKKIFNTEHWWNFNLNDN